MTEIAILIACALAMVAIWIIAKAGHAQQLRETAERQYLAGYQDAILGKEQADPLERIIRTATTKKEPQ
jgi:hypothetical protein